jgi:hypothetical protein
VKTKLIAYAVGGLLLAQAGNAAHGALVYAASPSAITRFDDANIGVAVTVPVTGLQVGETLVGLDVRPSGGGLFAVGSTSRVYTVDPLTGLAVQAGSLISPTLSGTKFGVDFNPIPDRLRVVSDAEQNLRINVGTGATINDAALNPAGNIVEVAYSNNFASATSTTLFGIDSAAGTLVTITAPNAGGPITTVGSLGLGTALNQNIGFDITPSGIAYAAVTTGGSSRLYTVNLTTGAATPVTSNGGVIGSGLTSFVGVTVVPEPASIGLLGVAASGLLMRRRRQG